MWAIYHKELAVFFSSLIAYLTVGIFLLALSLFLWVFPDSSVLDYGYASMETFFSTAPFIFMFLIPAITMRSIAEERKDGTLELLATSPLTEWQIIFGKFWSGLTIVVISLLPTLVWYGSIYLLGNPVGNIDTGAVWGSYIGLLCLGAAFVAVGIFASTLSKSQVLAFIIAVFLSFLFYSGWASLSSLPIFSSIELFVASIGINAHYISLGRGVLDTRDLTYFICFIILFLTVSKTVLGGRRW